VERNISSEKLKFGQKWKIWSKIENLVNNGKFSQKWKIWSKMKIWSKIEIFDKQ